MRPVVSRLKLRIRAAEAGGILEPNSKLRIPNSKSIKRQRDRKGAALGGTTRETDRALVRLGDPLRDRQSEAAAAVGARPWLVDAIESLEHSGGGLRRNANARVRYADRGRGPRAYGCHQDSAARVRVLDCIVQQIHGHPANQILIAA